MAFDVERGQNDKRRRSEEAVLNSDPLIGSLVKLRKVNKDPEQNSISSRSISLLGEEFVVDPKGIFSFGHFYRHPSSGLSVVLVGSNHSGDPEYYSEIRNLISGCEIVLGEGQGPQENPQNKIKDESKEQEQEQEQKQVAAPDETIDSKDLDQAMQASIQLYFERATDNLALAPEAENLGIAQDARWVFPESELVERLNSNEQFRKRFLEEHTKAVPLPPEERKLEIISFFKTELEKMTRGSFKAEDLGRGFVFLYSDTAITQWITAAWGLPRNEYVFENCFDNLPKDLSSIGIVFGAGHIADMRERLEVRGFELLRSVPIRNVSFEHK